MEKTNIPYEDWPEWIKTVTAFYYKRFIKSIISPKTVRSFSYLSFLIGILAIAESTEHIDGLTDTPFGQRMNFILISGGILNILIGVLNWFYNYKLHLWINENSSWEERFAHKSSGKHQFQYFIMLAVLITISCLGAYLFLLFK